MRPQWDAAGRLFFVDCAAVPSCAPARGKIVALMVDVTTTEPGLALQATQQPNQPATAQRARGLILFFGAHFPRG